MQYITFLTLVSLVLHPLFRNSLSLSYQSAPFPNSSTSPRPRPNIVIFMADDLGHADVSFSQGNLQTPTPNIDRFAWDGIILNRHYTSQWCTPSRAAFLTGKYSFHIGMNGQPITDGEPWGLPLTLPTQADLFRQLGYQTWNVGKWHLGSHQRAYYPGNRGFDEAFGTMSGQLNWFNYTAGWLTPFPASGRSVRANGKSVPANHTNNIFFPELLNNKAEQLIRNWDTTQPFYLYFSTVLPHSSWEDYRDIQFGMPQFQLRPPVLAFTSVFPERKKQLGNIQALDESFKRITDALTNKGVINHTIIVFFSDNGGAIPERALTAPTGSTSYGSNWPLRSGKSSLLEGGVRTVAFVWSALLNRRGTMYEGLFHVTDWLPTLWSAVGGSAARLPSDGDGYNHWPAFQGGMRPTGPRKEVVIDINGDDFYAIIHEDRNGICYKLIGGKNHPDQVGLGWSLPQGVIAGDNSWHRYTPAAIKCRSPEVAEKTVCRPSESDCLFDLTNDPCELNNLADKYPAMLNFLRSKIKAYNATAVPSVYKPIDPRSNPALWNWLWVPWLEPSGEIFDADPIVKFEPFSPSTAD